MPPTALAMASAPAVPAVRTDAAAIQPGYRDASLIKPAAASEDSLPPESQILDRWKDSGKPLR